MFNTEKLRHGATISRLECAREVQANLLVKLGRVLARSLAEGRFRAEVEPVKLHVFIASLCYFPVTNRYSLAAIFGQDFTSDTLTAHTGQAADLVLV